MHLALFWFLQPIIFSVLLTFTHYFCPILIMILTTVPACHQSTPPNYLRPSAATVQTEASYWPAVGQSEARAGAGEDVDLSKSDTTISTQQSTGGTWQFLVFRTIELN